MATLTMMVAAVAATTAVSLAAAAMTAAASGLSYCLFSSADVATTITVAMLQVITAVAAHLAIHAANLTNRGITLCGAPFYLPHEFS